MDRVWVKEYPPGVAADIALEPRETLVTMFERACQRYRDRRAFASGGRVITYGQLDDLSRRFAAWLQSLPGVRPGARVAVMLPNVLQYPVVLFGAWRAGMVIVNCNPLYTAHELAHQLTDSGATVLVIVGHRAGVFADVAAETPVRHVLATGVGDLLGPVRGPLTNFAVRHIYRLGSGSAPGAISWARALGRSAADFRPDATVGPEDLACLQYTGGTTGRSKGAMLTHRNLVANVRQINAWFAPKQGPGTEIVITPLPLYHVYALTCNCLAYVDLGALNVLILDPRKIDVLIRELRRWKFTAMTGVNTLYQALASHPDAGRVDWSHLKIASAGGMAVMKATADRWAALTGTCLHEGYGLSETSPVVTSNPATLECYNGSIGLPLPGTDVCLRDDAGAPAPAGESGELCVRGPQVMKGYWRNADATAASMTTDGYFRTGDIATMDARGYFRIVDRKKDMIDVAGLKVYPNEVEGVATGHPAIQEAACIGVPDERTGEAVMLYVVLRPGASLAADELRDWLRQDLAPYKIPRHVEFRDTLPKSPVGKVLRRELRDGHTARAT
jgi:long-chain acyl-CoA synthetase